MKTNTTFNETSGIFLQMDLLFAKSIENPFKALNLILQSSTLFANLVDMEESFTLFQKGVWDVQKLDYETICQLGHFVASTLSKMSLINKTQFM